MYAIKVRTVLRVILKMLLIGSFSEKKRKYPLRGFILGVLTHTTALDRLWGGD